MLSVILTQGLSPIQVPLPLSHKFIHQSSPAALAIPPVASTSGAKRRPRLAPSR